MKESSLVQMIMGLLDSVVSRNKAKRVLIRCIEYVDNGIDMKKEEKWV